MAERRMFAKSVVESDTFLDMSATARLLYFHLGMEADDDGFLNSPKAVMRMVGCSQDDLTLLCQKGFLIPFSTGVVVIRHWKQSNYIQKDRYSKSKLPEAQMVIAENGVYELYTERIQDVSGLDTNCIHSIGKDSIGKDRLEKDSIYTVATDVAPNRPKRKVFVKPTLEEVRAYCAERRNNVNPEAFIDHYNSNGWKVGRNSMKDWKAAVRTWERNDYGNSTKPVQKKSSCAYGDHEFDGIDGFC